MVKKLIYFLIPIVVVFLIVIFFSQKTTKYECMGKFQKNNAEKTVFLKLTEYRWWVKLWSDSDGMIWVEIPGKDFISSTNLDKDSNQIRIFSGDKQLMGIFSPLSNFLSIKTFDDFYDGQCKEIK